MVVCELYEPLKSDYGKRIIKLPNEVFKLLGIEEFDIVEVISGSKRIGVHALIDHTLVKTSKEFLNGISQPVPKKDDKSLEKDLPTPKGLPFQGYEIDRSDLYPARLDGEVRLSLNLGLNDLIEVDTILTPIKAKRVYFSVLGRAPNELTDEEKELLFKELSKQKKIGPLSPGLVLGIQIAFKEEKVLIQATEPDGIVSVTSKTEYELLDTFLSSRSMKTEKISYENIGGHEEVIFRIRKLVEIPIKKPEVFSSINLVPPSGILLTGPTGVGKTLLLKAVANESRAKIIEPPSNLFAGVGPTEKNIRDLFKNVKIESQNNPVLLILDNIHSMIPAPYINIPEYVRRFNVQFALGLDSLKGSRVIVLAACHSADEVDPIMRRPGRFDLEVELTVPTIRERFIILSIHLRHVPLDKKVTSEVLERFANRMVGYVGADIASFVKEACLHAVSRNTSLFSEWSTIPPFLLRLIKVNIGDLEEAFKVVEPSALRSIHSKIDIPNVKWEDVGGLTEIKKILQEQITLQFRNPEILQEMGIKPSHGLLFYGPPGNGKTLLAKAIATELQANFISVKGPELLSVWFGESAKIIRELFNQAQKLSPCIIFFDEIDAMVPRRGVDSTEGGREIDATVNQLLTLLDGMENTQGIFVMGATNRPNALDPALLRPGRLDRLILVPSPDEISREEILKVHTRNIPIKADKVKLLQEMANLTENYSGADLENLCREAVLTCLREDFNQREVQYIHFETALKKVSPSVDPELQQFYKNFATEINIQRNLLSSIRKELTYQ